MRKIGIVGTGNMGQAIGTRLARSGNKVIFGARRIEQAQTAAERAGHGAVSGSNDDAVLFADILVWTIRETNPAKVLNNPEMLAGKTVIDLNNRDYANEARNGAWFNKAISEELQENAPDAHVVKAWNSIAMEAFDIAPENLIVANAQTFIAGRNMKAKAEVAEISKQLGFEAIDVGETAAALRATEALGDIIRLLMIDAGHGWRSHLSMSQLPDELQGVIGKRQQSNYQ